LEASVLNDFFPNFISQLHAARKSLMENQLNTCLVFHGERSDEVELLLRVSVDTKLAGTMQNFQHKQWALGLQEGVRSAYAYLSPP
jgi:hypothetical protein